MYTLILVIVKATLFTQKQYILILGAIIIILFQYNQFGYLLLYSPFLFFPLNVYYATGMLL